MTYLGRQVVVIAKYIAVSQNLVEVGSRSVVASFCTTTTERLSVTDERSVEYCLATVREIITVVCCKLEILQERDFQIRAWSQIIVHSFTNILFHIGYHILVSSRRTFRCTVCFTISGIIHGASILIIFHVTFCIIGMNRKDRSPRSCYFERIGGSSGILLYTILSCFGISYIGTYLQPGFQLRVNVGTSCKTLIRRT